MRTIEKRDDYNSTHKCTWCLGCGNYAIWYMLKEALLGLEIQPHKLVIVYDIGCNGNGANFLDVYGFHGLHGRVLPVGQAIKLVNKNVKVIVMAGDGGGLSEGGNHFIHACRRNVDITYIMHDNQIYGLTLGQPSASSDKGIKSITTPEGNFEDPINPLTLALSCDASFVGRAYSGNPLHLKDMIKKAVMHKGFSFLDILQPCVTFNKKNTYAWYNERIFDINQELKNNVQDKLSALKIASQQEDRIPLGVFYDSARETYDEYLQLPVNIIDRDIAHPIDISELIEEFKI